MAQIAFVLACLGYFFFRGPCWALWRTDFYDLRVPYAAARAFTHGQNPYEARTIIDAWRSGNRGAATRIAEGVDLAGTPSIYPPTAFVMFAPWAMLPWHIARIVWLAAHLLGLGLVVVLWARVFPRQGRWQQWPFLATLLLFAPLHTAFANGQPALTVLILSCAAVLAAHVERDIASGVLIAAAICIKPHAAAALFLYYLIVKRWRIASMAALLIAMAAAVAIMRMGHVPWLHDLLSNLTAASAPGAVNDPGPGNPLSVHLVSLNAIVARFVPDRSAINFVAWGVTVALTAMALPFLRQRNRTASDQLLSAATLLAISMLPIYHRYYDAVLLLLGIAWAHQCGVKSIQWIAILFLCPPAAFAAVVRHLPQTGPLLHRLISVASVYPAWAVVGIAVCLVHRMRSRDRSFPASAGNESA